MDTMKLPPKEDYLAPDGSQIRLLVATPGAFRPLVVSYSGNPVLYNSRIGGTIDRLVEHVPYAVQVIK